MPKIGVITDAFSWDVVLGDLPAEQFFWAPSGREEFPTADRLAELDMMILVGPLADAGVAVQLSGVVKLALERSKRTFVFAYPMHVEKADMAFLNDLGQPIPTGNVPNAVFGYPKEFHRFFMEYGMSGSTFYSSDVERATVIGWIHENEGPRAPTALCWETERFGVVYIVPYFVSRAGSPARMVAALHAAVAEHRDALAVGLPSYLSDVRLGATEEALLAEIEDMERAVGAKLAEAANLERWRHLIGRTSGTSLVQLVVEALTFVLDGTGYRAEMRDDVGAEDFWIVAPASDFALAEAKGVGSGISRANIGQVDSHRETRGLQPNFPGLLIINAFRSDADLARKQNEDVAPNVVSLARHQNVVVMRTWDLYQLIGRKLDGEKAGVSLLDALGEAEGGWLRVDESGLAVVK